MTIQNGGQWNSLLGAGLLVAGLLIGIRAAIPIPADISVDPRPYDFGKVREGKLRGEYRLTNNLRVPVTIDQVQTSCRCTATELKKAVLEPGASITGKVIWDVTGRDGPVSDQLLIEMLGEHTPSGKGRFAVPVDLRANVIPEYRIEPDHLELNRTQPRVRVKLVPVGDANCNLTSCESLIPSVSTKRVAENEFEIFAEPDIDWARMRGEYDLMLSTTNAVRPKHALPIALSDN